MVVLERRGIPSDHPVACVSEDYDITLVLWQHLI